MFIMKRKQKKPTRTIYHFPTGTEVKFKEQTIDQLDPNKEILMKLQQDPDAKLIVIGGMPWGLNSVFGSIYLKAFFKDGTESRLEGVCVDRIDIIKRGTGASAATQINLHERRNPMMKLERALFSPANKTHYIVFDDDVFVLFHNLVWKVMGDGMVQCKKLAVPSSVLRKQLIKQGLHQQITIDGFTYDMYNKKRIVKWFKQNINRITENVRNPW